MLRRRCLSAPSLVMVDVRRAVKEEAGPLSAGDFRGAAKVFSKEETDTWQIDFERLHWPPVDGRAVESGFEMRFHEEEVETGKEVYYNKGKFFVRTDGSSFYRPYRLKDHRMQMWINDAFVKFTLPAGFDILVRPGIPHCLPYIKGAARTPVKVFKRRTNGGQYLEPGFGIMRNPMDDVPSLPADALPKKISPETFDLDTEFVFRKAVVHDSRVAYFKKPVLADDDAFMSMGSSIEMKFLPEQWPRSKHNSACPSMEQTFTMTWIDCGDTDELEFQASPIGLTGTIAGAEGRPGVIYDKEKRKLTLDLMLRRVDGTFFVQCAEGEELCMVISEPGPTGEPIPENIGIFRFGRGVRLPSKCWHSVPFPYPTELQKINLVEVVGATNAGQVLNFKAEMGKPITVKLPEQE